MTSGADHLLEHARANGGNFMVPRFLVQEPDILQLYEAGLIELDWLNCSDEVVAFFVVSHENSAARSA
ncbi:MAG: hypothetical protein U1E62_07135 [Alsobacter sp.]